jgi:CheY-like chemotaxis protein
VVAGGVWNSLIDPDQLENAILNLAINARDAMNGGGRLTIEANNASLDDEYVRQHDDLTAGQYVMIAVTDTGAGIPPEILDRVYEPFFTTKAEDKGTGLGLAMVYGFLKQSGGHVKIYSEVGAGTTVKLYFPREVATEDTLVGTPTGAVDGGDETILVVEDDDEVREVAIAMLTELGYRVVKARDAASALVVIDSGIPIDLIFTDVMMPGALRSPELARKRNGFPMSPSSSLRDTPKTPSYTAGGSIPAWSCLPSPIRVMRWPGRSGTYWPIRRKGGPLFGRSSSGSRPSATCSKARRCCWSKTTNLSARRRRRC